MWLNMLNLNIAHDKKRLKLFLYFLSGLCTEFNVEGGVIQIHSTSPCGKDKFPNCSETYKSSEAYKCMTAYLLNLTFVFQSLYVDLF